MVRLIRKHFKDSFTICVAGEVLVLFIVIILNFRLLYTVLHPGVSTSHGLENVLFNTFLKFLYTSYYT